MNETKKSLSFPALLGLLAGVLGAVASFLAWYNVANVAFSPWETTTGKITLVLAIVVALCGLITLMKKSRGLGVLILIVGLLYLGVVALNYPTEDYLGESISLVEIVYGYWLAAAAGALMIIGGLWKAIAR